VTSCGSRRCPLSYEFEVFLHVTNVTHLEDYKLRLAFNDGTVKEVDLKDELYGEVFDLLKDIELFNK